MKGKVVFGFGVDFEKCQSGFWLGKIPHGV